MSINKNLPILFLIIILGFSFFIHKGSSQPSNISNTPNTNQLVNYQKQSNFIHEFNIPNLKDKGLKGIVSDSDGNVWFYYQTNKTSTLITFSPLENTFNSYPIKGTTITDNSIINLGGGQLIYDEKRKSVWFTDARLNVLGNFDTKSSKMELHRIPTNNSGVMGLVLSPDGNSIWFTEITGNNIGSLDINSKTIKEYPTGEFTGPTLLAYDPTGLLWVTMSYSSSLLKVEPWSLIPGSKVSGIFEIQLEKPDSFSPFGIAVSNDDQLYVSDHGSSRVVVSNLSSAFKNYSSYWTSSSNVYPVSLPSQVISDKGGNVYFVEHGGNRISKISNEGLLTEFDIPTGPLATAVYLAITPDASKVWFTEWASNRIAFLDNSATIPLELKPKNASQIILNLNQTYPLDILVTKKNTTGTLRVSLDEIELSATGMTDSGLQGLTYLAKPQRFSMTEISNINGTIDLKADAKQAMAGKYTLMSKLSMIEKDNLTVSFLYPQTVTLDVPVYKSQIQNLSSSVNNEEGTNSTLIFLRDLALYASIVIAVTLMGYLAYKKITTGKIKRKIGK
jgi:virginiamycin B lyase